MKIGLDLKGAALLGLALGALSSSSAVAAVGLYKIDPLAGDEATATEGRAITPDGKYVAGVSGAHGVFWSPTAGTNNVLASGRQATVATGIGYRTVTAGQEIVIAGLSSGFVTSYGAPVPGAGAPAYGWTARDVTNYQTSPTTIAWPANVGHNLPTANSLGGTSTANWYVGFDHRTSGTNVTLWEAKGYGDPTGAMVNQYGNKNTPNESHIHGTSGTGRSVGNRRDVSSSSPMQNYYWDWNYPTLGQTKFKGLQAGTFNGEAWAVSNDGTKIGGYAPVDGGRTGNWPYFYDVTTDTIAELPTFNTGSAAGTNGIVYGLSADGRYAVGMDFTNGIELAVLWDTQAMTELNLTQFATDRGILGGFTGNLRRAYSVGVDADGNPVVTGRGFFTADGQYRGFVLTVPEPATLGFLAIGSVLMLRLRARRTM